MSEFEEKLNEKVAELLKNYNTFVSKKNASAGTRARKNAQELKNMMTEVRKTILETQKANKEAKSKEKENK